MVVSALCVSLAELSSGWALLPAKGTEGGGSWPSFCWAPRAFDQNWVTGGEMGENEAFEKSWNSWGSVNDLWPFPPHPLHCCGLVFWEWKMPEGGRRKGCAAYPFSPTSYNLLNFLCINRFSFPGISRHLFSSCGRHYVHWISFWNNETVLYIRD